MQQSCEVGLGKCISVYRCVWMPIQMHITVFIEVYAIELWKIVPVFHSYCILIFLPPFSFLCFYHFFIFLSSFLSIIHTGFDWLIVTTTTQCYIYSISNLNTPTIFDIKAPPHFLHLCKKTFLTLDQINGIQVKKIIK